MMQQVMNNPQMMQQAMQMMSNPQTMQQMMQMRQAMGMGAPGGGIFGNLGLPAATPTAPEGATPPVAGDEAPHVGASAGPADPMAAMMQQVMNNPQMMQQAMQMMSNPQMMQQMMQMRQAMGMGAPGGGMFGNLGLPAAPEGGLFGGPAAPAAFGAAGAGATDDMIRAQFAAQLS